MGEHGTWFDFLKEISGFRDLFGNADEAMGRDWKFLMFDATHFELTHVFVALCVLGFVVFGALRWRAGVSGGGNAALIPPRSFGIRALFEMLCDATYNMTEGVMGEKAAKKFFPFIASLALFIFFGNLAALIPGFAPATSTLKTNLALALIVFVVSHYYGIKEHGAGYIKQFMGPLWWLAPLMFPIELISHLARPVSLSLRLMGNMAADHKVIFAFFSLVPFFVPVPFYILGLLVCVVQTLVFCLLTMVYISMAISHDH